MISLTPFLFIFTGIPIETSFSPYSPFNTIDADVTSSSFLMMDLMTSKVFLAIPNCDLLLKSLRDFQ